MTLPFFIFVIDPIICLFRDGIYLLYSRLDVLMLLTCSSPRDLTILRHYLASLAFLGPDTCLGLFNLMLCSHISQLRLNRNIAEDIDKLLFAPIIVFAADASQILLDLRTLIHRARPIVAAFIIQDSLAIIELLSRALCAGEFRCSGGRDRGEVAHISRPRASIRDQIALHPYVYP